MNRPIAQALLALTLAGCCFGGRPGGAPPPPAAAALAPGFVPDPTIATGTAGGMIAASTFSPSCNGYVGIMPNHTYTLSAPFTQLRFTVTSTAQDTTMVVRSPDGQYFCNDDTVGLSPEVMGSFPAGQVQVYIGTYSSSAPGLPYTMEVSQQRRGGSIPTTCGMAVPTYGPIAVGTSVVLGGHTPWTGPDGRGAFVTASTNWAPDMGQYVGQRTMIISLEGLDDAGCPVAKVAADGGQFYWRIGSMSL